MEKIFDKKASDQLEQKKLNLSLKQRVTQVLCPEGYKAVSICISKQCNQPSFACSQQNCKCESIHEHCCTKKVKSVISKIQQKLCNFHPIIQKTKEALQEKIAYFISLIETLIKQQQQFVKNLQQDLFCGLQQTQKTVYKAMISKKTDQLKGSYIHNLDKQLKSEYFYSVQKQIKKVKHFWSQNIQEFETMRKKFNNLLTYYENKQYNLDLFSEKSNIVQNSQDIELLNNLFEKKIFSTKLLYRASQNQFSIKKFKQNCDDIPHTLILVETKKGKKVGIYTPLKWRKKSGLVLDQLQKPIMFSLTQKQTLSCSNGFNMFIQKQKGPTFIYGQNQEGVKFSINQKNNENFGNTFTYFNSKQLKVNFCQPNFLTKQWQVWQILLDD